MMTQAEWMMSMYPIVHKIPGSLSSTVFPVFLGPGSRFLTSPVHPSLVNLW